MSLTNCLINRVSGFNKQLWFFTFHLGGRFIKLFSGEKDQFSFFAFEFNLLGFLPAPEFIKQLWGRRGLGLGMWAGGGGGGRAMPWRVAFPEG